MGLVVKPHLIRGYTGGKGMVSRLASGGVVWQGHQHSISNVHRREKVDRRGARGRSRCLTLLWWLIRRAGRHIPPPEGGGKKVDGIWQDHILSLKRIAWASLVACHGLVLGAQRWPHVWRTSPSISSCPRRTGRPKSTWVSTGARSSSQVRAQVGEWATATVWMGGCGYLRTVVG